MTLTHSLRGRLLWFLFAAIIATACAQAVIAYRTALTEANSLFDFQMQQMAMSLRKGLPISSEFGRKSITPENQEEKFDFVVQIWAAADGRRIFRSTERAGLPRQTAIGFSTIEVGGASYRIFLANDGDKFIQIAQDLSARQDLARTLALRTVSPIGVLVPLLLVLVWWVVSTSLVPVARVRQQVASRNVDALDQVNADGLPDEIRPLVQELNLLFGRVRQAFDAQRNFVSDAAHELRSPLAALKLQVEGLRRAQNDTTRELAVVRLGAGIDRATRLVEQLLMLARQQASASSDLRQMPVDLLNVVQLVVLETAASAQARRLALCITEGQPCSLPGQEEALRILVRNLLDNAIKYTPEGGSVELALYRDTTDWVLQVADSGPGVPPAERARVLDRFYRTAGAEGSGSGLGLAIVQTVADLHGARLQLDSAPVLGGLRVQVRFPCGSKSAA